jgi:hypothetical protein
MQANIAQHGKHIRFGARKSLEYRSAKVVSSDNGN